MNYEDRIIAFEIRSQRIGYAIFEGPELLDWGVKSFRGGVNKVQIPLDIKLTRLFLEWQPHTVVLKKPSGNSFKGKAEAIIRHAKLCRIRVRYISTRALRSAFPTAANKYERARLLAASYPQLAAQLRPKRKAWQPEHYQLHIFDAVALGAAYYRQQHEPEAQCLQHA